MSIFELLRSCTVKIAAPERGTGFFVAPGRVMTCGHVVRDYALETLQLKGAGGEDYRVVRIERSPRDIDVVVLDVVLANDGSAKLAHPCVWLDGAFTVDDALYLYGFPTDFPDGVERAGGQCDGGGQDQRGALIAFRNMQIQPGHSGTALLNRETGAVCGVVNQTRGENTDYGGTAVPVAEILQQFPEVAVQNQEFHRQDSRWDRAAEQRKPERTQQLNVPYPRNPFFTGREDIFEKLHQRLQGGRAAINQTNAISGLGGIGKTQTAVEYAYRYFEVAYDWVFWVRADTRLNVRTDLGTIAQRVGLINDPAMELDQQIKAALQWLNSHGHWLLIVDNADGDDGASEHGSKRGVESKTEVGQNTEKLPLKELSNYLPTNPDGRVLITSRQSVLDMLYIDEPLSLEAWSRGESVDFLLRRTKRPDTNEERTAAGQLAETLGHLPLALEQAGAFIKRHKLPFRVYIKRYESLRLELLEKTKAQTGKYPSSVRTTWQINFDAVQSVNPVATELLKLSAVLAPDDIPYELLWRGRQHFGEALQSALDAENWDEAMFQISEVLEPLSQYSLIQWDGDKYCYSIHRMVQEVLLDQMKDRGLIWAKRAVTGVWQAFPNIDDIETWPLCDRIFPHGLHLKAWMRPKLLWIKEGCNLLSLLSYHLYKRGQYFLALEVGDSELEMRRELLGECHLSVATSLNNLAEFYRSQGHYEKVEQYYQQALDMRRELLGNYHPDVANSLNNFAGLYQSQGRYEEAENFYQQALDMRRQLLGDSSSNTLHEHQIDVATSLHNLACLYCLQGRYEEAEPYCKQSLDMTRELLGKHHPDVAASLSSLAILYYSQGRYEEAEPYFQQALSMKRELLGERHPSVAISSNNLARLYKSQGRYEEAEPYFQQALSMRRELLGECHPDVATSLNDLAGLYESQGRYEEAGLFCKQALDMSRELLGDCHPDVATSLNNLAGIYYLQGRYEEAEPFYKQALDMMSELLGERHPSTATSLGNLAQVYHSQGRYEEAEPFYKQALDMKSELLGERHPDVATSLNNLAGLYLSQGHYEEAEPFYKQALNMRYELLGERHPDVATSLNNLAELYRLQGRYEEAELFHKQSLYMKRELLGDRHPDVATSLGNLAQVYHSQGRYEEAEPFYQQAVSIGLQILGDDHADVAIWFSNLAGLYTDMSRFAEAETLYLQTLSIFVQRLGQNHPYVNTTIQNILGFVQATIAAGQESVLSDHPLIQEMIRQAR
ncbi:MAG: FxSxx-COOH system tetratricopeptide repeat protein [Cyanobacteria bacterium P01_F01_bin.150]